MGTFATHETHTQQFRNSFATGMKELPTISKSRMCALTCETFAPLKDFSPSRLSKPFRFENATAPDF